MNLPSSLIRGEILVLQAVVSNYLDIDLQNIDVVLAMNDAFKPVRIEPKTKKDLIDTKVMEGDLVLKLDLLKSKEVKSVSFLISPTKVGLTTLSIKALSSNAGDGERRQILIKSEGHESIKNEPILIDLTTTTNSRNTMNSELLFDFPNETLAGSEFCEIQLIGDILGSAFNNINNLLNKPCGCGEQNMLGLTPNIYALRYLNSLDSDAAALNIESFKNIAKSEFNFFSNFFE
jgi:CD109 antigen